MSPYPFIASILGAILLPLWDAYLYQGINLLIKRLRSPLWRRGWRVAFWGSTVVSVLGFAFLLLVFTGREPTWYKLSSMMIGLIILLLVPKLIFGFFLLAEDVVRLVQGIVKRFISQDESAGEAPDFLPGRRKFVSQLALATATVPFGSILYGITKGKFDFRVRKLTLRFADLPAAFDGFTLLQLSDIHSGSFTQADGVNYGVDLANAQQADLILFTGDMVNNVATEVEPWIDTFGRLEAPYGLYSTLGNHDYGDYASWPDEATKARNLERLKELHAEMGFRMLNNEHMLLEKGGEQIALLGVENWGLPPFPQKGDLDQALRGTEDTPFRILMSHDPTHWKAKVRPHPERVQLTLSGHTHGMQFGVEIPGFRWSPVKYRYPEWADLYGGPEEYLYVNRGFGYIGFPGRVGIWPEITVIRLEKA